MIILKVSRASTTNKETLVPIRVSTKVLQLVILVTAGVFPITAKEEIAIQLLIQTFIKLYYNWVTEWTSPNGIHHSYTDIIHSIKF